MIIKFKQNTTDFLIYGFKDKNHIKEYVKKYNIKNYKIENRDF